jgi:hypothetical protein
MNIGVHLWNVSDLREKKLFGAGLPDTMQVKIVKATDANIVSAQRRGAKRVDFDKARKQFQ